VPVDVILYSFPQNGNASSQFHFQTEGELAFYLKNYRSMSAQPSVNLLFIEDISPHITRKLRTYLNFQPANVTNHVKGRTNESDEEKTQKVLHKNKLQSTLFSSVGGSENDYSLTWWKLSTHSLEGYMCETEAFKNSNADLKKVVVPHFTVQFSDTLKDVVPGHEKKSNPSSALKLLKADWRKAREEADGQPVKIVVENIQEKIYKLDCHTYRPHQVITEVIDDMWGTACEERFTCSQISNQGSTYCKNFNLQPLNSSVY
jgi:hypothetical protein